MADFSHQIYLDYNATTPLAPEVIESISQSLRDHWGNPSSSYESGKIAKNAIDISRGHIAEMINGLPEDIVFTSGGTEGNHIVFHSIVNSSNTVNDVPHVITSSIEHDSILKPLNNLQSIGSIRLTVCRPINGQVTVDSIMNEISSDTVLISIMLANNETGILQPVKEIGNALMKYNEENQRNILLHTDAAQAIGKISVSVRELGVDYMTIVGHKFYGPRIGALYVRDLCKGSTIYKHMFSGGGQERGYRPGTENTPMIVGLGKAAHLVIQYISQYNNHMMLVRNYLEKQLKEKFGDDVHFNSLFPGNVQRLPNTTNISLTSSELLKGHEVVAQLKYSQVSAGAACHAAEKKASKVLLESGIDYSIAVNAVRISVGRDTSFNDIDNFINDLKHAVENILN